MSYSHMRSDSAEAGPAGAATAKRAEGEAGGSDSHFVFALKDVWPPVTDGRRLWTDEALKRLPSVIAAYSEYLDEQAEKLRDPVLIVTNRSPAFAGDGRRNELVASSAPSSTTTPRLNIYLQMADS